MVSTCVLELRAGDFLKHRHSGMATVQEMFFIFFLGFCLNIGFPCGAFSSVNISIKTGDKALLVLCAGRDTVVAAFCRNHV